MRDYSIDHVRNAAILLLFPVHTFMIWNDFGTGFYIWAGGSRLLSTCIVLVNPWFMPLLFVLAGISARYALEQRTQQTFIIQRVRKLLVPFLWGTLVFVPFQTWYARKYFDGCEDSYWENLKYFFTHVSDLSGYDGAFTPGHLWFILFLFLIAMLSLLIFRFLPYEKTAEKISGITIYTILILFVPIWLSYYVGNFGGFSIGKDFSLYLIGYYVLSNDAVRKTLEQHKKFLSVLWIISMAVSAVLYYRYAYYGEAWVNFMGWLSILAILTYAEEYLNKKTKFMDYFNRASYPVYILHQSVLVVLAYYVLRSWDAFFIQVPLIMAGSFVLTIALYHIIRKIPVIRELTGIIYR